MTSFKVQLTARLYESGLLDLALERSGEARKPQALVTGFTRVVIIQMPGNINLLTFNTCSDAKPRRSGPSAGSKLHPT